MTSGIQTGASTRRDHIRQWGRALALAATNTVAPLVTSGCVPGFRTRPEKVKVGILHSQTGTMSISETSLRDAEILAIEEINASGGILGRQLEPVVEDGRSRFTTVFPKKARKLLVEDKVAVVFGCWTSASRKAVLPVFEELDGLLFYPVQYEGNESSRNIVYTGATPNQQILPAIDWLMSEAAGARKRLYLIGSDYVFPRTANYIITRCLQGAAPASWARPTYRSAIVISRRPSRTFARPIRMPSSVRSTATVTPAFTMNWPRRGSPQSSSRCWPRVSARTNCGGSCRRVSRVITPCGATSKASSRRRTGNSSTGFKASSATTA